MKEAVPGKRPYSVRRRGPSDVERIGAALLLVLDQQLVHAGRERDRPGGAVHLFRRITAKHQLAVDMCVQPVVALSMDLNRPVVRHVPIATPSDAEAPSGKAFVLLQEIEGNACADLVAVGPSPKLVLKKELSPQPGSLSRLRREEQPRGRARQGNNRVDADSPSYPADSRSHGAIVQRCGIVQRFSLNCTQ